VTYALTEAGQRSRLLSRLRSRAIVGNPTTRSPVSKEFNSVAVATVPIMTDVCHLEILGMVFASVLRGGIKTGSSNALLFRLETVGDG